MTKIKHYEKYAQEMLARSAKTERHYVVPGTGHGYTLDLEQAQKWAMRRSKFIGGKPVPVLYQDVQLSAWSVASDQIATEVQHA